MSKKTRTPLDHLFPDVLVCNVVQVGDTPRIHGFDALGDLGENFSTTERLLISLTGNEPVEGASEILDRLMAAIAARGADEIPAHSGVITQLFCTSESTTLTNVSVALSCQASAFADWIVDDQHFDIDFRAALLWLTQTSHIECPRQTFLSLFETCGLTQKWQIASIWFQAALPAVIAESMSANKTELGRYPMNLPPVEYRP